MAPSMLPLPLWALTLAQVASAAMNPGSYAPNINQTCPSTLIRQTDAKNQTLNQKEIEYLAERRKLFPDAWKDWVGTGSDIGYDLDKLGITSRDGAGLPVIGLASSGGGYRAAQFGAGVLSAFDGRNSTAKEKGTGGLFQVSSYLSGLSGGSWLVTSMLFNNFPDIHNLVLGDVEHGGKLNSWFLEKHLFLPDSLNPFDDENQYFFGSLLWSVNDKGRLGLDTSLTDIWARALSYHFLTGVSLDQHIETITTDNNFFTNDTSHGAGVLWHDIANIPVFQQHEFPLPIVVADVRPPGFGKLPPDTVLFLNSTVFEFTPWEMGSYDPDLSAFVDVRYLGTHIKDGKPETPNSCVTGFDQASFVFGTSSSLFNQIFYGAKDVIDGFDSDSSSALLQLLRRMLSAVSTRADDVGNYPNPFEGLNPEVYQDSKTNWIELIDGATNKENVPLGPLFVKARGLDMIVAIDTSGDDDNNWPVAESIYASRNRTVDVTASVVQKFPPIPETQPEIGKLGLNQRPTFFGCDPKESPPEYPLIVYMPNMPPVDGSEPVTNTGTFKLKYETWHTSKFLDQAQAAAFNGFMPGETGADKDFGKCLQCAALDRSRLKADPVIARSDFCTNCFKKYCYDPENPPPEGQIVGRNFVFKDPDPFGLKSFFQENKVAIIVGGVIGVLVLFGGCFLLIRFIRRGKKIASARYARLSRSEGSEWSTQMGRQSYEMAGKR